MADGIVQVAPDSTGKKVDTSELTVSSQVVERQRVVIGDDAAAGGLAAVKSSAPAGTEQALVVRNIPSGTQTTQHIQDTRSTGTITTGSSVVGPVAVANRSMASITINGTYSGVTFITEGSDDGGTTYYPIMSTDNSTGKSSSTWTPGTNATSSYDMGVAGLTHVRVRATAWTSGTANVGITAQAVAIEPVLSAIVNDLQDVFITGAAAQSSLGNNAMLAVAGAGAIDTLSQGAGALTVRSFCCQIEGGAGISAGAVIFEGSNDGTNFVTLPVWDSAVITGTPIQAAITISASTHRFFMGKTLFRYIRCRISTAFVGGTIQAFTKFSALDFVPPVQTVGQPSAGNMLATVSQATAGNLNCNVGTVGASANLIGDVGMQVRNNATGAASVASYMSPATPAGATIKAGAGRLVGFNLQNSASGVRSVKFFNATSVTMGTTSATWEVDIPAGGSAFFDLPAGIGFATGLMLAVTSAKGLTDNTATGLAANDVTGFLAYA